jgi:hypothetical protein
VRLFGLGSSGLGRGPPSVSLDYGTEHPCSVRDRDS